MIQKETWSKTVYKNEKMTSQNNTFAINFLALFQCKDKILLIDPHFVCLSFKFEKHCIIVLTCFIKQSQELRHEREVIYPPPKPPTPPTQESESETQTETDVQNTNNSAVSDNEQSSMDDTAKGETDSNIT